MMELNFRDDEAQDDRTPILGDNNNTITGAVWTFILSIMLFWLPLFGFAVAGFVGGRKAGSPLRGLLAVLVPSFIILTAILTFGAFTGGSDTGLFSGTFIGPGEEMFPSLSPDGELIVYASNASGNWDIIFQRVDGETALNLTENSATDDMQPAFSPDGKQIAFRSERDGGGIFLMGATVESVRRLTDFGFNPDWAH